MQNQHQKTEDHLRVSIELDSDRAAADYLLAQVLEAQGKNQAALEYWQQGRDRHLGENSTDNPWKRPELKLWKLMATQRLNQKSDRKL